MEELFILQEIEFQILAGAMGIKRVYGIKPETELDETNTMYTIHEMTGKGILLQDEKGLYITEPYRTALQIMKNADQILTVAGEKPGECCFYFGEKIVSLESSRQDKNAVKIGLFEREMLCGKLQDGEFLPQPLLEMDIACLQSEEDMLESENPVYDEFCLYSTSDEEAKMKIFLLENPCNYWIKIEESDKVMYMHYSVESCYDCLKSVLH